MDKHAFSRTLFPSYDRLQFRAAEGKWSPNLYSLRARAVEQTAFYGPSDKELERFMSSLGLLEERLVPSKVLPLECNFLDSGVWLSDFERMPFYPSELDPLFEQLFSQSFSIAHYGCAVFNRFQVLYIPPGTVLSQPIKLSLKQSAQGQDAQVLVLIVGAGSSLKVEMDTCVEQGSMTSVLLGSCGEGASVTFTAQSVYGPHARGLTHELWQSAPRSSLHTLYSVIGGLQVWNKRDYYLEEHACVTHRALSALKDNEQEVLITRQIHKGAHSTSSVLVKTALSGASRSFYRGTILIEETARSCEARQQQRALMLSSAARVCALPTLEVATSQVRCSHGSAAGGLNDEQVQYLCARGLSREQAYMLLIEGFFQDEGAEFSDILKKIAYSLKGRCSLSLQDTVYKV